MPELGIVRGRELRGTECFDSVEGEDPTYHFRSEGKASLLLGPEGAADERTLLLKD